MYITVLIIHLINNNIEIIVISIKKKNILRNIALRKLINKSTIIISCNKYMYSNLFNLKVLLFIS